MRCQNPNKMQRKHIESSKEKLWPSAGDVFLMSFYKFQDVLLSSLKKNMTTSERSTKTK